MDERKTDGIRYFSQDEYNRVLDAQSARVLELSQSSKIVQGGIPHAKEAGQRTNAYPIWQKAVFLTGTRTLLCLTGSSPDIMQSKSG